MELNGKTALITGGAHRVGRAITLGLAAEGANVVINYRSSSAEAVQTALDAVSLGVKAVAIQADISDPQQVQAMVNKAQAEFGSVDVLVNSASPFIKTPFPMQDFTAWHKVTSIIMDGALYCANAVAPLMLEKGEGAMIFIVDLSAFEPWQNFGAHSVAKSALLALSRQLALELAPTVCVNAVAPGPVLAPPDYTPEKKERIAQRTLLKRWGTAEDVAQAVVFLAQSNYITGEVIAVDGGQRFGHRK